MKVCTHRGHDVVVLTRNEHCPPHVHSGSAQWEARLRFSFWEDGIDLLDVVPDRNRPSAAWLSELQRVLFLPENLKRTRVLWWRSRQTVYLDNQWWDTRLHQVVEAKTKRAGRQRIWRATFDESSTRQRWC